MTTINEFKGDNFFLSNFYEAPVEYQGLHFLNNEAAFQAMKCPQRAREFCKLNPSAAKKLGRSVDLRPDWEGMKDIFMYEICTNKFLQNPELLERLLATGDATLIEGNDWNDKIWGVCNGQGENRLGKILMRIREEQRNIHNGVARKFCVLVEWNYCGTPEQCFERCVICPASKEDEENNGTSFIGRAGSNGMNFEIYNSLHEAIIKARFNPFAIRFSGLTSKEIEMKDELLSRCRWSPQRGLIILSNT